MIGDEICFTKPSVDLEPFKSEHEGYTGNAGNTVDRWYHRAAVLLWPRARTFAIRSKASPEWGIREIAKALVRGKANVAKQRIGEMLPFWNSVAPRETEHALADQVLHVANAIDDVQLATALVEPIRIEQMAPKMAVRWIDLLTRYGLSWCAQVFERWTSRDERHYDHAPRTTWLVSLPALSAPLCARGGEDAVELVRRIVRVQWTWLNARLDAWTEPPLSSHSLKTIEAASRPLVGLLAAAVLADDRDLQSMIVARLAPERGYAITSHELPVTHVTRRTGSPYTLVLTKTRALFTRAANERATWIRDLAWLRENAKTPRRTRAHRR